MNNLDNDFGRDRVIDSPVSESAITGLAVGASISGSRTIVVHPRMDFMLYAMDAIVNQAAKWRFMFNGNSSAPVTIRAIINRGGEQGAQHSQDLHAWFAHVPGLKVVMPYSVSDARDLLIASTLSPDPVLYIDDRWLYDNAEEVEEVKILDLELEGPNIIRSGRDVTIVGSGYSTHLAVKASEELSAIQIDSEVIDLRVINPYNPEKIIASILKTGNLIVVDGGTRTCSFASEVITSVMESIKPSLMKNPPIRITLPDAPAPTSKELEKHYYISKSDIIAAATMMMK
jgi:pyruvate dehydrogenase E1 component beta subunit